MGVARQLAERIAALKSDDLPAAAYAWGKVALADTLACALAGCGEAAPRIAADALSLGVAPGPCLVLGGKRRTAALDAALLNGVSAHVLDYDNTGFHMGGHVSAVLWPALLAAAEGCCGPVHGNTLGSGRDLLLAHAVGFEAGARLGNAVNFQHSEKGWHPTATLGVFAVTAACARLLALDATQTETALALAASLACGIKANFGTMAKSLHVGECARAGLMAVLLARKGFSANPQAFEHKQGFFNLYTGPGQWDAAKVMASWGQPFEIVEPGAGYKLYPCCHSTHAPVEATLNLVREHGRFDAASIARIDSYIRPRGLVHTDRPQPQSALDAKFSVQYCVARAALYGEVTLAHFAGEAFRDTAVQALLPRVHASAMAEDLFPRELLFAAEVRITLADGRQRVSRVDQPLGRTAHNPVPQARMRAKFDDCARRVLGTGATAQAWRLIEAFEDEADVSRLMQCLTPAVDQAAAATVKAA